MVYLIQQFLKPRSVDAFQFVIGLQGGKATRFEDAVLGRVVDGNAQEHAVQPAVSCSLCSIARPGSV